MVTSIEIVPAQATDVPAIQAVASASWRATYAGIFTSGFIEQFLSTAYREENLACAIERAADIFCLAWVMDQVAGFVHAEPNFSASTSTPRSGGADWARCCWMRWMQNWLRAKSSATCALSTARTKLARRSINGVALNS